MTGPHRSDIRDAIEREPALVTYLTAGDPSAEATAAYVRALERGGADVIELGLPFSEPIADGPTIQNAITRSLDAGMTPKRFFDLVSGLGTDVPLVVMTYYNLVLQYGDEPGVEAFVKAAADAGLSGLIIPDLPVEESGPLREACTAHGLDLIFIIAPTTQGERLARVTDLGSGFIYVQARLGTTGARGDVSGETHDSLARLDTDVPAVVGFGVSEGSHATEIIAAGADGVVAGSVFVDIIAEEDESAPSAEALARLERKARDLKQGALAGRTEPEAT